MNEEFYQHIFDKQQETEHVPSNGVIAKWGLRVVGLMYPAQSEHTISSKEELKNEFAALQQELHEMLDNTSACCDSDNVAKAARFFNEIPELYRVLNTDIEALFNGDPAAKSEFEVVRAYPGFKAISFYRMAHALVQLDVPLIPRILTEFAHSQTGIDIHPAAQIGEYLYIDHGTGIVVGETAVIGKNVKLYQGITLGALSVHKELAYTKRHPTVEDNVVIYSGATILGGETVIGQNSIIGGNVWLTKSVPPYSMVYHKPAIEVVQIEVPN